MSVSQTSIATNSKYGLHPSDLDHLMSVFKRHPSISQAILFGSSTLGNYKAGRDVDIALQGTLALSKEMKEIRFLLDEEGPLPYQIGLLVWSDITNEELKRYIQRVGVPIYQKNNPNIL
ncbi:nucleotidyltransferase family protein [Pleomorphovibrio marinus]|uniref:nucleotidyltransferase family protein n=1 Tax=Pleomorphovibrio marinus TaxID=2164132 RepID=UPI0013006A06|nr:nucleotidyltransferase domain-containing protein [Pleomorphovibrio marinus]